jgi:radical SAM protein with 4Fe4S-binding SPASM domain
MQLSNYCNMSCTMCYDGDNPPLKRMPDALMRKVGEELLPTASILTPFSGSEPLVYTWNETRELAERYQVELEIVTNLQFLDEKKFWEMEPHVARVSFSIDSHIPEVYEGIRLRANTAKVFRHLPEAARLCKENGIDVVVNVVFMTENAAWVPETVAFMADAGVPTVQVMKYLPLPHRWYSDPARCYSQEYIDHLRDRCAKVAEEKGIQVLWQVGAPKTYDFRSGESKESRRETRCSDDGMWQLRHALPGYCAQSVYRAKVTEAGHVYPCCVATEGELLLGNMNTQSFDDIWNGPNAQDLRRAMLTWDVPTVCSNCAHFVNRAPAKPRLPFVDSVQKKIGRLPRATTLQLTGPPHLTRTSEAPVFSWKPPDTPPSLYVLAIAPGIDPEPQIVYEIPGDAVEFRLPDPAFDGMRRNVGYWWTLWAIDPGPKGPVIRGQEVRCVIHHQDIPRVEGSTLNYGV